MAMLETRSFTGLSKALNSLISIEIFSKPQIRFKGKAQADRESAAYIEVCEHLSEACNAAIGP